MFSQSSKTFSMIARAAGLAALLAVATVPTLADAGQGYRGQAQGRDAREGGRRDVGGHSGYVLDSRYNHNRYYPVRGYTVGAVPRGAVTVTYHGSPYFFAGGAFYRPFGPSFVVVRPAIGIVVPFLPPFYTTVWFGGVPFYYADNVYYAWHPAQGGYAVVDPPGGERAASTQPPPGHAPSDLFVYPKNGQGEEQQARDKYECHSWAANQSGFDPTQPLGGVPEDQATVKRADYQRAMQACLDARGYSVR